MSCPFSKNVPQITSESTHDISGHNNHIEIQSMCTKCDMASVEDPAKASSNELPLWRQIDMGEQTKIALPISRTSV